MTETEGAPELQGPPEVLSPSWRRAHTQAGDEFLARAEALIKDLPEGAINTWHVGQVQTLAALATAHYAAANVRAKWSGVTIHGVELG